MIQPCRAPVIGVLGAWWIGQFDESVAELADEPGADLSPQPDQVAFGFTLVHREEHLGTVERLDRLDGYILGGLPHRCRSATVMPT